MVCVWGGGHRIIIQQQNKSCLSLSLHLSVCLSVLLWCNPLSSSCFFKAVGENQRRRGCLSKNKILYRQSPYDRKHERFRTTPLPRQDTGISYQKLQMYPIIKSSKGKTMLRLQGWLCTAAECLGWTNRSSTFKSGRRNRIYF